MSYRLQQSLSERPCVTRNLPSKRSEPTPPFSFSTTIYRYGETDCDFVSRRRRVTTVLVGVRYYGYRYYMPDLGRWVNRDPIGEMGGVNIYSFAGNCSTVKLDPIGLSWSSDLTGIGLLIQYYARLIRAAHGGMLINEIDNNFSLPAFLVKRWPPVKKTQEALTKRAVANFCANGEGDHSDTKKGKVQFESMLSVVSFNISTLAVKWDANVEKSNECDSCLRYEATMNWEFSDEIDAKSLDEWPDNMDEVTGAMERAMILYEAAFDLFGDKLARASFYVKSDWDTHEEGCCPRDDG